MRKISAKTKDLTLEKIEQVKISNALFIQPHSDGAFYISGTEIQAGNRGLKLSGGGDEIKTIFTLEEEEGDIYIKSNYRMLFTVGFEGEDLEVRTGILENQEDEYREGKFYQEALARWIEEIEDTDGSEQELGSAIEEAALAMGEIRFNSEGIRNQEWQDNLKAFTDAMIQLYPERVSFAIIALTEAEQIAFEEEGDK